MPQGPQAAIFSRRSAIFCATLLCARICLDSNPAKRWIRSSNLKRPVLRNRCRVLPTKNNKHDMKNQVEGTKEPKEPQGKTRKLGGIWATFLLAGAVMASGGCHKSAAQKANTNFFTSGSREADQRASQRMAQSEQLAGTGEGSGEKGVKKAKVKKAEGNESTPSPTGTTNV